MKKTALTLAFLLTLCSFTACGNNDAPAKEAGESSVSSSAEESSEKETSAEDETTEENSEGSEETETTEAEESKSEDKASDDKQTAKNQHLPMRKATHSLLLRLIPISRKVLLKTMSIPANSAV